MTRDGGTPNPRGGPGAAVPAAHGDARAIGRPSTATAVDTGPDDTVCPRAVLGDDPGGTEDLAPTPPDEIDDVVRQWKQDHPEIDPETFGCFLRLKRLSRDLEMCAGAVLRRYKLTVGEFDVLAALRRAGPSCTSIPSKLSEMLMLSRAGMTNRLDRLEAAGLAERRLDPSDRRSFQIALTERGRQVIDAALAEHMQLINRINAALPPDQRQCLDQALRALLAAFQIAEHARKPSTSRAAG